MLPQSDGSLPSKLAPPATALLELSLLFGWVSVINVEPKALQH
jgi:hypothetical protein